MRASRATLWVDGSSTSEPAPEPRPCDAAELLRDLAVLMRPELEEQGVRCVVEIGPDRVLRLFIKPFMDAMTYDQHRVDRCCVRSSSRAESGVCVAGFRTTGHPAASAGASLCATRLSGKLNGLIPATGPIG